MKQGERNSSNCEVRSSPGAVLSDAVQQSAFFPIDEHNSLYFDDDAQNAYAKSLFGFSDYKEKISASSTASPSSPIHSINYGNEMDKWCESSVDLDAILDCPLLPAQSQFLVSESVPSPAQIFEQIVSECQLIERRSKASSLQENIFLDDRHGASHTAYYDGLVMAQPTPFNHYYDAWPSASSSSSSSSYTSTSSSSPSSSSLSSSPNSQIWSSIRRVTRSVSLTAKEMAARKRMQNRKAAARYRNRQKLFTFLEKCEIGELEERNAKLRKEESELEMNIASLKKLIFNRVDEGDKFIPK